MKGPLFDFQLTMDQGFTLESLDSITSTRYKLATDVFQCKLHISPDLSTTELLTETSRIMSNLAEHLKEGLHPENDRIGISIEHPDLLRKSINVPFQRPANLSGMIIFTRIGKVFQSQESLALDGKLRITVQVVKGVKGRGRLTLKKAGNFFNFMKNKRGIVEIDNADNLCLPRALAVGIAYIQCYKEHSISENQYRLIKGTRKPEKDKQGLEARQLCANIGLDASEYVDGSKTFGMAEIRAFALYLVTRGYGISVHNSMTANTVVFETPGLEGQAGVLWVNLLNLNEHFSPITSPNGFFSTHFWCDACNRGFKDKMKHRCIDHCSACMTMDTDKCTFYLGRTKHCAECNRDFYGDECFKNHMSTVGKHSVCSSKQCCKDCSSEFNPRLKSHKCGYSTCVTCKEYAAHDHECYMQPFRFPDEIAFDAAGNDPVKLQKAEQLALDRQRKSRYVVWDLETFALNQESGKGRLVPHVLVAATVCYKCLGKPFKQQHCRFCDGLHNSDVCISNEEWRLDNSSCKLTCWAENSDEACDECGQQQLIARSGTEEGLFKPFVEWMMNESMRGFSLVAHNGANFDSIYVFRQVIQNFGFHVDPIFSGSKLLQFTVKQTEQARNIQFRAIDSAQFFQSALKNLPKQFGLDVSDMKKGFFPYRFDRPCNWNYIGAFPDLEIYSPREMNKQGAAEVTKWHGLQVGKVFHFRREMLDYCLQDVRLLLSAMQVAVKEDLDFMGFDGMAETCTIAAKTMMFFRYSFLRKNTIGCIPQNGYSGFRNQSREGLLWLLLQEIELYPGLQHSHSRQGEKSVCGFPVDGFHEASNTVLQYHGCYFHGCPKCHVNRSGLNELNGETFETLHVKTQRRTLKMRNAGFVVVEKWGCDVTDEEMQRASALGLEDKVSQLIPKDAFYGGRTEAVTLHTKVEEPANEIKYYDVTSEYPYVNARKMYPLGHPTILLKHQLPQSNDTWKDVNIYGAVKCSILPPPHLFHPVLPYRQKGALMFPLCHTCCEEKATAFCEHNESERVLHGTWMSIEINEAIERGYKLVKVQEAWHFDKQSDQLFRSFINALYKAKLEASGFPHGVDTEANKQAYKEEIIRREGVVIELDKVAVNPGRRQMAKILLNSFWVSI
jgi:G:T-mismatch repair DNA endonuclease (very short patch repair protein)